MRCFLKLRRALECGLVFVLLCLTWSHHAFAKSTVTYCVEPDWMPYEAIRDNRHVGISADFIEIISAKANIQFELVPTESWEQSLEYVQLGRCEVIAMVAPSPNHLRFLDFSQPYFEAPNVLVAKSNSPYLQGYGGIGDRIVGVTKASRHAEYIARYYPDIKIRYIDTELEGMALVNQGKLDVMVGSLLSVNNAINSGQYSNAVIVGYAEPYDSMTLGVMKSQRSLISVFNEAIASIPESNKVEILKRWHNVKVQKSDEYTLTILIVCGCLLALTLNFWRRRVVKTFYAALDRKTQDVERLEAVLTDKNRTLEFLSSHDSLTGLYNRNYMLHKVEDEVSRFQRFNSPASLILIDIDNLKPLADKYGVEAADEAVKHIANVCLATVREVDVAARWSAHSLLILCPQTPVEAVKVLGDRLLIGLAQHSLSSVKQAVVSIGMASLADSENFSDWFERANRAAGMAKRDGHNCARIAS